MRTILYFLPLAMFATGLTAFAEDVTKVEEFLDVPDDQSFDSNILPVSSETPDVMGTPNVLNDLGQVLKKLIQFDMNITSTFNRRVIEPILQVFRTQGEPVIAKGLSLLQRITSNDNTYSK